MFGLGLCPKRYTNVIDGKTVFPAYHMNKKHWITVLLGENTDRNLLEALIDESISLVKAN